MGWDKKKHGSTVEYERQTSILDVDESSLRKLPHPIWGWDIHPFLHHKSRKKELG